MPKIVTIDAYILHSFEAMRGEPTLVSFILETYTLVLAFFSKQFLYYIFESDITERDTVTNQPFIAFLPPSVQISTDRLYAVVNKLNPLLNQL